MNRTKVFARASLIAAAGLLSAACNPYVEGSGILREEVRDLPSFTAIELSQGFIAEVSAGFAEQQVHLIADDNLLEEITTEVRGGTLIVELPDVNPLDATLRLRIAIASLNSVACSGGSQVKATGVAVEQMQVALSGGSRTELSGSCGGLSLQASGGSQLLARGFDCETGKLELSGGSQAEVKLNGALDVTASGGSEVRVWGHPQTTEQLSGGSRIVRQ